MEDDTQKYRGYLARITDNLDPADAMAFEAAYERLRAANEQFIAKNAAFAASGRDVRLREAAEAAIAGCEKDRIQRLTELPQSDDTPPLESPGDALPAASVDRGRPRRGGIAPYAVGALAGAALCIAVGSIFASLGVLDVSVGATAARKAAFEADYQRSLQQLDEAVAFLRKVEGEVRRKQQAEPDALEGIAARRFVRLQQFDPALAESMPASLPTGARVLVRADRNAYKVLLSYELCSVAFRARPELVDPKRAKGGPDCSNFGLWNEAGASF